MLWLHQGRPPRTYVPTARPGQTKIRTKRIWAEEQSPPSLAGIVRQVLVISPCSDPSSQ